MKNSMKLKKKLLPAHGRGWQAPETCLPSDTNQVPLDARGARWAGLILPSMDLRDANLCRADLRGTDLSACLLDGCDLRLARYDNETQVPEDYALNKSGAIGPGASLNGAFLNGADLRGMDLRKTNFMGAYLSGCDLSGSILKEASFVGTDLRFARLQGCQCVGSRFSGCQLNQADLRATNFTDANPEDAESIHGADFSLATGIGKEQLTALLTRGHIELDCWNPFTRLTTRSSLESLCG